MDPRYLVVFDLFLYFNTYFTANINDNNYCVDRSLFMYPCNSCWTEDGTCWCMNTETRFSNSVGRHGPASDRLSLRLSTPNANLSAVHNSSLDGFLTANIAASMDTELKCNSLPCRKSLTDKAVVVSLWQLSCVFFYNRVHSYRPPVCAFFSWFSRNQIKLYDLICLGSHIFCSKRLELAVLTIVWCKLTWSRLCQRAI